VEQASTTTPPDQGVGLLGYPHIDLGLNNQKLTLFGLFCKAREQQVPLALPEISLFNPATGIHGKTTLDQVYPVEGLHRIARAFGIGIAATPPVASVDGWSCFVTGSERVALDAQRGLAAMDDFTCQFFRHLRPALADSRPLAKLKAAVFRDLKIAVVAQLRIEKDWAEYSATTLAKAVLPTEDYAPSFLEIMGKIKAELPGQSRLVYVVCDESDLPVPKEEIRKSVSESHGITLVWKSDFLTAEEIGGLSILELSVLDFEMALTAPIFVGLSRSTFSNMASFEVACRDRRPPAAHFIYNLSGPKLGQRCDSGARIVPEEVVNPLYLRAPLVPPSVDDIAWPATLTAHVASFGDLTSEGPLIPGVPGGAIICGRRGAGAASLIEGFAITTPNKSFGLEYRALLDGGSWTPWSRSGAFLGSRSESRPLRGFAARLTGPLALSFEFLCIGSFLDKPDLVAARGGQDCCTEDHRPLEALQLLFRRRLG
jgi:hypothetical protein